MQFRYEKIAGFLFFIGGAQCILGIIISEALFPGYSTSENWISDLGVGPSASIFNSSLFLLGLLGITGTYFIHKSINSRVFSIFLATVSIGAIGVGVFTEDFGTLHSIFSLIVFLFSGLSAIISHKILKKPFSYLAIAFGTFTLVALVLTFLGIYVGLGKGGMERMIVYPALIWLLGFSSNMINYSAG